MMLDRQDLSCDGIDALEVIATMPADTAGLYACAAVTQACQSSEAACQLILKLASDSAVLCVQSQAIAPKFEASQPKNCIPV